MTWKNWPMNDEVHWPRNEGVVGVLGVAPLATADFCLKLANRPAKKDWNHVRVLVDSNPKIPSRGRCLELGETDPTPFLAAGIANLAANGATVVAVPCNTAHIFYDGYTRDAPVYVPHIVDVACKKAQSLGIKKVLLLASRSVVKYNLYADRFKDHDMDVVSFPDQELVSHTIEMVKQNKHDAALTLSLRKKIESLKGFEAVILGCTEISLVIPEEKERVIIDSNKELADFCVSYAQGEAQKL